MVNRAPAPQIPDRNPALQTNQIAQIVDATPEQLDSIKKYQVNFFIQIIYLVHSFFVSKWSGLFFMFAPRSYPNYFRK